MSGHAATIRYCARCGLREGEQARTQAQRTCKHREHVHPIASSESQAPQVKLADESTGRDAAEGDRDVEISAPCTGVDRSGAPAPPLVSPLDLPGPSGVPSPLVVNAAMTVVELRHMLDTFSPGWVVDAAPDDAHDLVVTWPNGVSRRVLVA